MNASLPRDLKGRKIHFVGIKGTGMTALVELLAAKGAQISGSDVPEKFFTDEILDSLHIPYSEGFSGVHVPNDADLVVYSAAYNPETNPELLKATELGLPTLVYTDALGEYSARFEQGAAGISGVHGKTTTTAMTGVVMRALNLPFSVLAGSMVPDFGNRATWIQGETFFVAETCEYKRHFLSFHPTKILVTSIELDHTDYFENYDDIFSAFVEYSDRLPKAGTLVYCADEKGAVALAEKLRQTRPDLHLIGYGYHAEGPFRVVAPTKSPGTNGFRLAGWETAFALRVPGDHNVLNAAGAIALGFAFAKDLAGSYPDEDRAKAVATALTGFRGSRRRSQIVGETDGVLVMDDYGHHPTAIALTLSGLRDFYPGRRIIVDFMSHTYSRTKTLLEEFAASFQAADEVVLHKIYASARETQTLGISGRTLFEETQKHHAHVFYFEEPLDALKHYRETLREGDVLVTMGAGDNWRVGKAFLEVGILNHKKGRA